MNEQTLLIFAQRILNSSSEQKARVSLRQLKTLRQEQGASKGHIALLEDMILSMPEMKEAARKPMLTKADAEIAGKLVVRDIGLEQSDDFRSISRGNTQADAFPDGGEYSALLHPEG